MESNTPAGSGHLDGQQAASPPLHHDVADLLLDLHAYEAQRVHFADQAVTLTAWAAGQETFKARQAMIQNADQARAQATAAANLVRATRMEIERRTGRKVFVVVEISRGIEVRRFVIGDHAADVAADAAERGAGRVEVTRAEA